MLCVLLSVSATDMAVRHGFYDVMQATGIPNVCATCNARHMRCSAARCARLLLLAADDVAQHAARRQPELRCVQQEGARCDDPGVGQGLHWRPRYVIRQGTCGKKPGHFDMFMFWEVPAARQARWNSWGRWSGCHVKHVASAGWANASTGARRTEGG